MTLTRPHHGNIPRLVKALSRHRPASWESYARKLEDTVTVLRLRVRQLEAQQQAEMRQGAVL